MIIFALTDVGDDSCGTVRLFTDEQAAKAALKDEEAATFEGAYRTLELRAFQAGPKGPELEQIR